MTREIRQDVAEVLVRYAIAIDTRDWTLFRTCFTGDCEADYGDIGAWRGLDELTAWMEKTHAALGATMHRITNPHVTVEGDTVSARSYVDGLFLGPGGRGGFHTVGFYDDALVRGAEGWRIARRRFTRVLQEPLAPHAGR